MKKTTLLGAAVLAASVAASQAALVTSWTATGGTNSGLGTASPTIGDDSANNADDVKVNGTFTELSLLDGQTIVLSGTVTFSGVAAAGTADQFRFGLFDDLGDADNSTWDGYRAANDTPGATGHIRLAGNSANNPTTFSGTDIGDTTGFGDLSDLTYSFSLSLTRNGTGIDLVSSMTNGGNDFASGSLNHATADTFDFNSVGFLLGGALDADQASFSNIDVSVVPEPSSAALLGLGGLALILRRRK